MIWGAFSYASSSSKIAALTRSARSAWIPRWNASAPSFSAVDVRGMLGSVGARSTGGGVATR